MLTDHIPLPESNSLLLVIMYADTNDWIVVFCLCNGVAGRYATEAEARAVRDELRIRCAVHYALTRAL